MFSPHTSTFSTCISRGQRERENDLQSKVSRGQSSVSFSSENKSMSLQKLPFVTEHASADTGRYFYHTLSDAILLLSAFDDWF